MNEEFFRQLVAELIDANEQAIAILASATGDVIGRQHLHESLQHRLTNAQAAQPHPIRDKLLTTAMRALKDGK